MKRNSSVAVIAISVILCVAGPSLVAWRPDDGSSAGWGSGWLHLRSDKRSPEFFLFQITETGLAAELGVTGAKYFKDNELN